MNYKTYLQYVQKLREYIYKTRFDELESKGFLELYLLVSANLLKYIPKFNKEEHYKIIQDIQFHRSLSSVDQYFPFLVDDLKIIDKSNVTERSYTTSHIFVTYHTGSYRMFIQYLNKKDVSFCLVTQERFIKDQKATVQKLYKQGRKDNKDLEILPAENPRLIFELNNRLRKGISVVFYIDGNTGATEKKVNKNNNSLKIDFLNHHIYARQGIAFLAYLSKSPIAIAVAKRNENLSNTIHIKPLNTSSLLKKYNRNEFINTVTQKLYRELERFLRKNPEQWEGWFYIQKFFEIESTSINLVVEKKITYNSKKPITLVLDQFIHLIKHDEERIFLVTRRAYQIMKISNLMYEILRFFKTPQKITPNKVLVVKNQVFNWRFVKELIEMKFIKPVI